MIRSMARLRAVRVALIGSVALASASASTRAPLPEHPRLLVTRAELPAVRARATSQPWARAYLRTLRDNCDRLLAKPIDIPARGGQWSHWYSCKKHGARLRTESPTKHVCPIDGEVFTGYPYDEVIVARTHHGYADEIRDMGLLYQITGERKYSERARQILLGYAERYGSFKLHDTQGRERVGGGRITAQTLNEAIWIIAAAQGADCIWDVLTPAQREELRAKLFYPAAVDTIQKHRMGIHNIQCWKNSAVGLVGFLYDDPALIAGAIDGPTGYRQQAARGVNTDGQWNEGAWGYHFYTMNAMAPLTEAARRCGIDLYKEANKRMFLAPIAMAMPDGALPAFNDSNSASAAGNVLYEIGLARHRDPALAGPVASSNRRNLSALLCGVSPLPAVAAAATTTRDFEASGYAVLAADGAKQGPWLCLKYGPHGGGHGHPDKGSFVLFAGGRALAGDPGTAAYGVPIQAGWYRTTLAHNTVLADERSQAPATGKCLEFRNERAPVRWCGALLDAGPAIASVTFRRAAAMIENSVVVFVDAVSADDGRVRTYDLAYHPSGSWATRPSGTPIALPDKPGYSHLRDVRESRSSQPFAISTSEARDKGDWWVSFAAGVGAETTYWTGTGVGANTEDRVPIVVARRSAPAARFIWAVGLRPGVKPALTVIASDTSSAAAPTIVDVDAGAAGVWRVTVSPSASPGRPKLSVTATARKSRQSGTDRTGRLVKRSETNPAPAPIRRQQPGMSQTAPIEVDVRTAHEHVTAGSAFLLDVRGSDEYGEGHAVGAVNIPLPSLPSRTAEVPESGAVYVICASGMRSASAAQHLRSRGYTAVSNVVGGTTAWSRAGLPMEAGGKSPSGGLLGRLFGRR